MAQIWEWISENGLVILGLVIAAITAFGVFYGPRLAVKGQEKTEKLRKHFNELMRGAIERLIDIIANIDISNGSIITHSPKLAHLDSEQLECFQAHYLALGGKWQELAGKWTKYQGRIGGRWAEHNEKAETFENEIKKLMSQRLTEAGITLPIKPYRVRQEVIDEVILSTLLHSLYEQAEGQAGVRDFSKAIIVKDSDFYTLEVSNISWAAAKNRDIVKKCKSIFVDIQNSPDFKKEAALIIEDAKQIKDEFQELLSNLNKIKSRGFISRDPKYRFQAVKRCPICKELFY